MNDHRNDIQEQVILAKAIRAYEGAATTSEIADEANVSTSWVRTRVKKHLASGYLVEKGVGDHGARCYGLATQD